MAVHIDITDPKYREAAAQVLLRHDSFQPEANITSAANITSTAPVDAVSESRAHGVK